ncbi:SPOR domain-containing protein [Photobacterium profundum]|uniref:Hypothetical DamX-related protein n=1 Tax=Photobacterium profundum (strain SS9) TaxID=298386 RepID=Q6LIN4_PHOPR|nr:SPOR domain-containing protein [Photobacterium profundum]CAG22846.1 hypothetical DamX-related protein [Photobacterium profundum SS9]
MRNVIILVTLLFLSGCATNEAENSASNDSSQCVGVMTTTEAYGHMDPARFTIQILAISQERDVRDYISEIKGQDPIWVNWKRSRGQNWYAVIYGDFATKDEAKRVIDGLSFNIRQQGPFVRSFADVQSDKKTDVFRMR